MPAPAPRSAAAWDTVEELSAAASHAKEADKIDNANDPLEKFCDDNPDADECRCARRCWAALLASLGMARRVALRGRGHTGTAAALPVLLD